jgi:hypothetical protein
MLKPKNNYRWPEMVKKARSDEAFKQFLISDPKQSFKQEGINIPSNIEIIVHAREYCDGFFVLPHQNDVDILEPIDTWTRICQKAWSNPSAKLDLISHWEEILIRDSESSVSFGNEDMALIDEIGPSEKLLLANRINAFLDLGSEHEIINSLQQDTYYESMTFYGFKDFFEDTEFKKNLALNDGGKFFIDLVIGDRMRVYTCIGGSSETWPY